jgi:isocitrate dehydrogenase
MIHEFSGPGVLQGVHNTDESIRSFAQACFTYSYDMKMDMWFSAKDTISKTYDGRFKQIFEEEFKNWEIKFREAKLTYFFTLIDDLIARVMKSEGGFLWACKNYDGDVMSDMVASAFGSLAMMTSVLVSPEGFYEFEAAHGTVQKHYYKHMKGEETSTNSMALIFAWTGAIRKRAELDSNNSIIDFCNRLEEAAIETIESGIMTGDLILASDPNPNNTKVSTEGFIDAIKEKLETKIKKS